MECCPPAPVCCSPEMPEKPYNVAFNYTTTNEATGATATHTFSEAGGPFSSTGICAVTSIRGAYDPQPQ